MDIITDYWLQVKMLVAALDTVTHVVLVKRLLRITLFRFKCLSRVENISCAVA